MSQSLAVATIVRRLTQAEALLTETDLTTIDPSDLPQVTASLRRIEGRCSALGVAIANRAKASGGDPSATLLGQGKVSGRRARQEAKRADVVGRMPELGTALNHGDISGEHIDAVARASGGLSVDEIARFDQLGPEIATAATKLPVDTFARRLRTLVDEARADHGLTRLEQQKARSSLKMWVGPDDMGHLHLTADPERFAQIQSAIEAETKSLAAAAKDEGQPVTKDERLQLDALVELLGKAQGACGRPAITVLVDETTLANGPHSDTTCETVAGVALPLTVIERYLCDSVIQHVTVDEDGLPLDVGRRYRTATRRQWVALEAMYATCVWHQCDRPITWTQAHHIHEWEHGGSTDLMNLVPLCSKHHHMVHDGGWRLWLRPDRKLEIHRPATPGETPSSIDADRNPSGGPRHRDQRHHHRRPGMESLWATTRPDRQSKRAAA